MSKYDWKKAKYRKDNCPCKGCVPPKRHGGCHSECGEYRAYEGGYHEVVKEAAEEKQRAISSHTAESEKALKNDYIKRMGSQ